MGDNDRGRTYLLEDVIREAIRVNALETHTFLPGRISAYDATTQTATVIPEVQRVFEDDQGIRSIVEIPDLEDVPIVFPGGGGFSLLFPVVAGDKCLLLFAERDIQNWRTTGQQAPPGENRFHDYSDPVAMVGIRTKPDPHIAQPTNATVLREDADLGRVLISADMVEIFHAGLVALTSDGASGVTVDATAGPFTVDASGAITLTRGASELLSLISQAIGEVIAITVTPVTLGVAAPINNPQLANLTALQVLVDTMRT